MNKRLWAFALALCLLVSPFTSASAATLGPASSYDEMLDLLAAAKNGDTLLISGEIDAEGMEPLTTSVAVHIEADDADASIRGLRLCDADVTFSSINLSGSLYIEGNSSVLLGRNVSVSADSGETALSFEGSGALIIERGCTIEGGRGADGVYISHTSGDFYGSIEGQVFGGSGHKGGAGLVISPLGDAGALMISGQITGGDGESLGGHAANLYGLSGNAYITVDGTLCGGSGSIGGDGLQLVSISDNVAVGVTGRIKGGSGESHGGDALILMNASDSSSFHLSGSFSGGDASSPAAQPGTSLQLVGDSAALRTHVNNCILEDGLPYQAVDIAPPVQPDVTPLPEIPPQIEDAAEAEKTEEPAPTPVPDGTPEPEVTPAPEADEIPLPDQGESPDADESPVDPDAEEIPSEANADTAGEVVDELSGEPSSEAPSAPGAE